MIKKNVKELIVTTNINKMHHFKVKRVWLRIFLESMWVRIRSSISGFTTFNPYSKYHSHHHIPKYHTFYALFNIQTLSFINHNIRILTRSLWKTPNDPYLNLPLHTKLLLRRFWTWIVMWLNAKPPDFMKISWSQMRVIWLGVRAPLTRAPKKVWQ